MRRVPDSQKDIFGGRYDQEKGRNSIKVEYCPKNIDSKLKSMLFNNQQIKVPLILTSATITQPRDTLESQYQYQKRALGFTGSIMEPKPSPFDYDNHARLYIQPTLFHRRKTIMRNICDRYLNEFLILL